MKNEEYLKILLKDKNIHKQVYYKALLKRLFLSLLLISAFLVIFTVIESFYWQVFLNNNKTDFLGLIALGLFILSMFGLIIMDNYNPLSKIGNFNTQFFTLLELLIEDLKKGNHLSIYLRELIIFLYRYVRKINIHANSLYIFDNTENIIIIAKLLNIVNKKFYTLFYNDKDTLINLFQSINKLYEYKLNDKTFDTNEFKLLIKFMDKLNNYEIVKTNIVKEPMHICNLMKNKNIIIILTILFLIFGFYCTYLMASGSKYTNNISYIFTGIGTTISIILGIISIYISLKDK